MRTQPEAIINHFSHPHPLRLTHCSQAQPSCLCAACKQTITTEPFYACVSPSCTTFFLHLKCTQLPHRINHPFHHHPLSLLPNPNRLFTCNACRKHGDGFLYFCNDCGIGIHVACATLPLSLSHRSHGHRLNLVFSSPYGDNNAFSCDVCGVVDGSKCWLYRCGSCGFDAHLSCAASKEPVFAGVAGRSNHHESLFLNQINNPMGYNREGNMNHHFLQTVMGGGGGGGQFLQAIMGGGGGGGSNDQFLQAITGGGGDMAQAISDDTSNIGFGGLDFSSVVGNINDSSGLMGGGFGGFDFSN
ncbi:hypothetical protein R6Q59_002136 [Mikania micrantha]